MDVKPQQVERAQRLQDLLLAHYESRLSDGSISGTEVASLQRLLLTGGWTLDPDQLPKDLRERIKGLAEVPSTEDEVEDYLRLHSA